MNNKYVEAARQQIPSPEDLINVVSQRARQLMAGSRPLVEIEDSNMDFASIALKEIAEGKVRLQPEESDKTAESKKKKKK